MAPAAYQQAAQSIYEPQKQAEQTALQATRDTTKNTLEASKSDVANTYQQAVDKLTQSVQSESADINLLYSQRLGGNFSGLQGNDMGALFSRANQQQGYIESERASKLAQITTGEANADIEYNAGITSLTPKYQSLESEYAAKAYGEDTKAAQDQANKDRDYNLQVAKYRQSGAAKAPTAAQQKQADMGTVSTTLEGKAGKDGHVSQETWNAALSQWTSAGYSAADFVKNNMQYVNQRYSGYHGYS